MSTTTGTVITEPKLASGPADSRPIDSAPIDSVGYPRKRRQTRRRLLQAGTTVLAERGPGHMTAAQVARSAEVAIGTFYNHFPTVGDVIEAIANDLGRGIEISSETLTEIEHDPAQRVALGVFQLLDLAEQTPDAAAAFASLVAELPDFRARVRGIINQAIVDGAAAGRFDVEPGPAATNAVLGTSLQSIRSRLLGETTQEQAPEVVRLVLRVLGTGPTEIDRIIEQSIANA